MLCYALGMSVVLLAKFDVNALPGEVEPLQQLVKDLVAHYRHQIAALEAQLESLQHQMINLRRVHFGASSEQLPGLQPDLFADEVALPLPPQNVETITYERRRNGRPRLPPDLSRLRVEYDLSAQDKAQYVALTKIGEDKSEQLHFTPARLQVLEHVRFKYACTTAQGSHTVRTAEMPPQPLPKSNASPELLAHVLVSKYQDHLPLNRQQRMFERHGLGLARSTLCDWVLGSAELLNPLYQGLKAHVLSAPRVHVDETILPLQQAGHRRTVQARAWAYVGAGWIAHEDGSKLVYPEAVVFEFTANRSGEHPQRFLKNYQGYLQADAYAGYQALYERGRQPGPILEVGCWAHCRRHFYEVVQAEKAVPTPKEGAPPSLAAQALLWIGKLYEIERAIKDEPPDKKCQIRQQQARPVLEQFRVWLEGQLQQGLLPKGPTAKAIRYALDNWTALTRYCESGLLEIDNNRCERAIRPLTVGRANWLFTASHGGGQAAAVIYSLIETAKRHNVEPYAYLADVLRRLPCHPINRVTELLPFSWQRSPPHNCAATAA